MGPVRPQDKFVFPDGTVLSNVEATENANGTTTYAIGTMAVTIDSDTAPSFATESTLGAVTTSTFALTASDLEGLKALVNGEVPAGGDDDIPTGPRTLSGEGNNVDNPGYGAADTPFIRLTDARYGSNGSVNPIFNGLDPRAISNALGTHEANLPKQADGANIFFMAFGQYVDHGLDFIQKGGNGTIQIGAPGMGPGNPLDLTRATVAPGSDPAAPKHINKTSNFIDQNQAYGSNDDVGTFLREPDGNGGVGARLFFGGADGTTGGFDLLPTLRQLLDAHIENGTVFSNGKTLTEQYTTLVKSDGSYDIVVVKELASNFFGSTHALLLDTNPGVSLLDHIVAGDGRANENISLTAIHTIWARNHNYHVENLLDHGFTGSAEEIFQAAKMINEAEYQRVVLTEFTDKLLGGLKGSGSHGHDKYNPNADPGISHEFAAAAYRFGHSLVAQNLTVLDGNGNPVDVPLLNAFLNPGDYAARGANAIIGGIVGQAAEEVDVNIVDAVRNDLVRQPADLFAFNVARGRDVGLGTLNQVRKMLSESTDPYVKEAVGFAGNLSAYRDWDDFKTRNNLSAAVIAQFMLAYPDLVLAAGEIDAFATLNPVSISPSRGTEPGSSKASIASISGSAVSLKHTSTTAWWARRSGSSCTNSSIVSRRPIASTTRIVSTISTSMKPTSTVKLSQTSSSATRGSRSERTSSRPRRTMAMVQAAVTETERATATPTLAAATTPATAITTMTTATMPVPVQALDPDREQGLAPEQGTARAREHLPSRQSPISARRAPIWLPAMAETMRSAATRATT